MISSKWLIVGAMKSMLVLDWSKQKVAVWGAGRSGIAAVQCLQRRHAEVHLFDEHLASVDIDVPFFSGRLDFEGYDLVVLSPGIPPHTPWIRALVKSGTSFVSEVELGLSFMSSQVLAVTGTDGKSTTCAMLNHILNHVGRGSKIGGNFGVPVCEIALEDDHPEFLVLEISAFQLWSSQTFSPQVAAITNIASDHLDYFSDSFEAYRSAKLRICREIEEGVTICRADLEPLVKLHAPPSCKILTFSEQTPSTDFCLHENELYLGTQPFLTMSDLKVVGRHNALNALCAVAMAQQVQVSLQSAAVALTSYCGLEHRMEWTRTLRGVRYFNDSKATNPHAAITGLLSMDGPLVVIAGGYDKGLDLDEFVQVLDQMKAVVLTGPVGNRLFPRLGSTNTKMASSLEEAVSIAGDIASSGDTVILSPGSSSFDEFKSFAQRGAAFKRFVSDLA